MNNMINFGIDLGTTNSAIAKFTKGNVQVFKHPSTWKETLPSVIAFRKDRIFIGDKAKEFAEKDPKNVISRFKRKMGTVESFKVAHLNESKTPVELSSEVLKELKSFVQSDEALDSVTITIPASFDMIQSNATKEAGLQAGFKQVVLLQEPIAASLAFANMKKDVELADGQWLVYDLGGGTFDVALVKISNGEMKVLDHEGNNFLGGSDFDDEIVKQLIIPKLNQIGEFNDLETQMTSASGKYNAKFLTLRYLSEKAKIELSTQTSAEINIQITDDIGFEIDDYITITRSEFENIIQRNIDETVKLVNTMLTRQSLSARDLQFVLMVGGSTFIPFVRKRIGELLNIPINCDIDPTTAVAQGAAYFAGTKPKKVEKTEDNNASGLKIKMAYQKASKEKEEYFAAKIIGDIEGLSYRITRDDRGFDTGLIPLTQQISQELPLVENSFNYFTLVIYDCHGNLVETNAESIEINSGYSILGQPLPSDVCLEVDDLEFDETKLELIFPKNTILPVRKTIVKPLNRTLLKDSTDTYRLSVLAGSHQLPTEANKSYGFMEIQGAQITRNVSKGSDIELTFEISESQDLVISAYLTMTGQEFKQVFSAKKRGTSPFLLVEQITHLSKVLDNEIQEASNREDYETARDLHALYKQIKELEKQAAQLSDDDMTDKRYQLEDHKQKLAQEISLLTINKRVDLAKDKYLKAKQNCTELIGKYGNDYESQLLEDIIRREEAILTSNSPIRIREATEELDSIIFQILWRVPEFLSHLFQDIVQNKSIRLNDQQQAKVLIETGYQALEANNWEKLADVNRLLISLLPEIDQREIKQSKIGF